MAGWWKDLVQAARALRRRPALAAAVVLTSGLAIGANTIVFGVVDEVLLTSLPYPDPGRVVRVHNTWNGTPDAALSPAEYLDYRDRLAGPAAFGVYATGALNLTGGEDPLRVEAAFVSAGAFPAFGVSALAGRLFTVDEDDADAPVAMLTEAFWRSRYGGDPGALGRGMTLNGQPYTIVGILPSSFALPEDLRSGTVRDLVLPLGLNRAAVTARGSHFLRGVARLGPGESIGALSAEVATIAAGFAREYPDDYPRDMAFSAGAMPMHAVVVGDVRSAVWMLAGAVGFVLLVACANVANLLLARLEDRRRELAVRTALGAGRARLVRQLLSEALVLAAAGGILGLALAWWGTGLVAAIGSQSLPRLATATLDGRVVLFAAVLVLVTAALAGVVPAVAGSDVGVAAALRAGDRGAARRAGGWYQNGLVVGQVALALILLSGAALLGRSFLALRRVDPGFRHDHVLTARLSLPSSGYDTEERVVAFYEALRDRLDGLAGIEAAGAVSNLPLATTLGDLNVHIEGRDEDPGAVSPRGDWQVVTPGYFDALRLTLRQGRLLDARDRASAPGAIVINEAMARRYWPDGDALGARMTLGGGAGPGVVTVVGVVGDVRHEALGSTPPPQMYLAHAQFRFWNGGSVVRAMSVVARTAGDPAARAADLRAAVRAIDADLPVASVQTMDDVYRASLGRERLLLGLIGSFAALALGLGLLGVHGVMAHGVGRRTREIGVRMALGASAGSVVAMILRRGGALVAAGITAGVAGTLLLTGTMRHLVYGIAPNDPLTIATGALALAGAALVATWVPARRAAAIDPMEAMRHE